MVTLGAEGVLKIAIPSDGALYEPTLLFLDACGLRVNQENRRRYTASIPFLEGISVIFQRSADITDKIEEGSADLGILGHDRYLELRKEDGLSKVVMNNLGFGACSLALGIPDSWIDVSSIADLADLATEFHNKGESLRIATKSPRLVEGFLLSNGISHFSLVQSSGTLEVAPAMGFADIIADITSSGTTMRENHLKTIQGGTVIESEACLIGNKSSITEDSQKLALANRFTEIIQAHMNAEEYFLVTANIQSKGADELSRDILKRSVVEGLVGPTISKVYSRDSLDWYAVTIVVDRNKLMDSVRNLREMGAASMTVTKPNYVFESESDNSGRLI
ncbi:MAG: ATP phosphoribosyltransferase [Chloroflexota bacterium]|nr:ATP phosphoribosyltransferase [Chloroflexota bacterium]